MRWFAALFTVAVLAAAAGAQEPGKKPFDFVAAERIADQQLKRPVTPPEKKEPEKPAPPPSCRPCMGTSMAVCPQHKMQAAYIGEGQLDGEKCKLCNGISFLPCPTCKGKKEVEEQWKGAEDRAREMLETMQFGLKEIENLEAKEKLDLKLTGFATARFSIGSTLDKKLILPCIHHGEGMLEKLNGWFKAEKFYFFTPVDTRFHVMNSKDEFKKYLEFAKGDRQSDMDVEMALKGSGMHWFTQPSTAVNCFEKLNRDPVILQHTIVHFLGHFAINRVAGARSYPAWLEEGFAAAAEALEMKTPRIYCFAYVENKVDIKNRDAALRRLAQVPVGMDRLTQMKFLDMKGDEYFQAWSMVAMLVDRDPEKFIAFLKALPAGTFEPGGLRIPAEEQEEALKSTYGYDFAKLLIVWRQYAMR
jgi:hypothetical protein